MHIRMILLLLLCQLQATAQTPESKKAQKIYARYVEQSGGIAHWESLESYRRVSTRTDGLQVTTLARKPDQFQLIFDKGTHHVIKSYDGNNGWLDIDGVYHAMRPGEEIEMAEEPEFYEDLIKAGDKGYALTYEGLEMVGKIKCHKLRMIKSKEDNQWYWINAKTYRLEMTGEYSQDPAHAGILYTTRFEDYRKVGDYEIPFTELLIRNGGDTLGIHYQSMEVNPVIDPEIFFFTPKDQRNCVRWMQDDLPVKLAPGYTFVQQTLHYHEEKVDTSTWYEALVYPDLFRIDFNDIHSGNCNLNIHDTLYAFRKHALKATVFDPQIFLFAEGSIYTHPLDTVMHRLHYFHVDTSAFTIEYKDGQALLVFGRADNEAFPTLVKIDSKTGLLRYEKEWLEDGKWLELEVVDTQQIGAHVFPKEIVIFLDGKLVQRESYVEVDPAPDFPEGFFDPARALEDHWYKTR